MKIKYTLLFVFCACSFVCSIYTTYTAQEALAQASSTNTVDLAVTPPVSYLSIQPGTSQRHLIEIQQNGLQPLFVTPSVVGFKPDGRTGQPILTYDSTFDHYTLQLPSQNTQHTTSTTTAPGFVLQPGERKSIGIVLDIPDSTIEREYPLSVLFFTDPIDTDGPQNIDNQVSSQANVTGAVGSNLIVLVSRTDRDRGKLLLKSIDPPFLIDSLGDLTFEILAKNEGINATTASGSATVRDWQGKIVARYYFFPDMILANSTRLLRNVADNAHVDFADFSNEELETALENFDSELLTHNFTYSPSFLIGPYTITAELFQNGQTPQQGKSSISTTVIALPYSIIAVVSAILIGWVLFYTFKQ